MRRPRILADAGRLERHALQRSPGLDRALSGSSQFTIFSCPILLCPPSSDRLPQYIHCTPNSTSASAPKHLIDDRGACSSDVWAQCPRAQVGDTGQGKGKEGDSTSQRKKTARVNGHLVHWLSQNQPDATSSCQIRLWLVISYLLSLNLESINLSSFVEQKYLFVLADKVLLLCQKAVLTGHSSRATRSTDAESWNSSAHKC